MDPSISSDRVAATVWLRQLLRQYYIQKNLSKIENVCIGSRDKIDGRLTDEEALKWIRIKPSLH